MTFVEVIGYLSAAIGIAMFAMQTMIPLRAAAIAHNVGQIVFGLLSGSLPTVAQHVVLLPLNSYRLFEMLRLIKRVKVASTGDHSLDWLKPFMTRRAVRAGETLFRKGDEAAHMYFVIEGRLRIEEIGIDIGPGAVVGELGMLSPNQQRTQTVVCAANATILEMSYERIEQLYFQNPQFGFYFLRLSSARLFDNIDRLERTLAEREQEIRHLRAAQAPARV